MSGSPLGAGALEVLVNRALNFVVFPPRLVGACVGSNSIQWQIQYRNPIRKGVAPIAVCGRAKLAFLRYGIGQMCREGVRRREAGNATIAHKVAVQRRQLAQDDVQRPAVDHGMMAVEEQNPSLGGATEEKGAKQRTFCQVEYMSQLILHGSVVAGLALQRRFARQLDQRQLERYAFADDE